MPRVTRSNLSPTASEATTSSKRKHRSDRRGSSPPPVNKRSRAAATTRDSPLKRVQTRSDSGISVVSLSQTPEPEPEQPPPKPKSKQMARRSGGPPLPKRKLAVEIPKASPAPAPPPPTRTRRSVRLDDDDFVEAVVVEDELSEGEAGPGPQTAIKRREGRADATLGPVHQSSPRVVKSLFLGSASSSSAQRDRPRTSSAPRPKEVGARVVVTPRSSQASRRRGSSADDIGDFSSPTGSRYPEEPLNVDPAAWVHASQLSDDDAESTSAWSAPRGSVQERHPCHWSMCQEVLDSAADLSRHIRQHADLVFPEARLDEPSKAEIAMLKDNLSSSEEKIEDLEKRLLARGKEVEERNEKVTSLESRLQDVEEQLKEAFIPPPVVDGPPDSIEAQFQERDASLIDLRRRLKETKSSLKRHKEDLAFFREQYDQASTRAVEEVRKATELQQQTDLLREQLRVGLKQRDLHHATVAKQSKAAADKAQKQVNLLLEQSRRTDDTVRRKAADHAKLADRNHDLESELHEARSKADSLSKRNQELSERVSMLQGKLLGAFDPVEESEPEADYTDEDDDDEGESLAPPSVPHVVPPLPAFAPDDKPTPPAAAIATLAEGGIEAFRCKWADDGVRCLEIFHTLDELQVHGIGHIHKLAIPEAN
ncbi:hypothetical protein Q8F55_009038 [Vanrija albida]|uniref:C2H2-type domain-containing protein n=1 Tax=Vanrija albida TaxID=181172 RepID=A0ABR3PSS1_9TREE